MIFSFGDLVGNALIEAIEEKQERKVTYRQLENYKKNLLNMLETQGLSAIVSSSKYATKDFFYDYDDFFSTKGSGIETSIFLKENKGINDLRRKFRAFIPLKVLILLSENKLLNPI